MNGPKQSSELTPTPRSGEKLYLNVPFAEKDQAKAAGTKWDGDAKKWFAPAGQDIEPLRRLVQEGPTVVQTAASVSMDAQVVLTAVEPGHELLAEFQSPEAKSPSAELRHSLNSAKNELRQLEQARKQIEVQIDDAGRSLYKKFWHGIPALIEFAGQGDQEAIGYLATLARDPYVENGQKSIYGLLEVAAKTPDGGLAFKSLEGILGDPKFMGYLRDRWSDGNDWFPNLDEFNREIRHNCSRGVAKVIAALRASEDKLVKAAADLIDPGWPEAEVLEERSKNWTPSNVILPPVGAKPPGVYPGYRW